MNLKSVLLGWALVPFLAGCGNSNSDDHSLGRDNASSTPNAAQAAVSDKSGDKIVTVAFDSSKNEAESLASDQEIAGEFSAPRSANVDAVEIQVGNFSNSSVGQVNMTMCQNSVCSEGTADLGDSKDNAYFRIALKKSLTLIAGQEVLYKLKRISGSNSFAVWVYPSRDSSTSLTLPDGKKVSKSLNIRLVMR